MTGLPPDAEVLGEPVDRIDGRPKVTGGARYPSDVHYPGMAYAALVQSAVAAGTIRRIETAEALAAPGVLAVLTHENAPPLADGPASLLGPPPRYPLRDARVVHHGQHVAVVVADTAERARTAARLVRVAYEEDAPRLDLEDPGAAVTVDPYGTDSERGDVPAALAAADVVHDETFRTAPVSHCPIGPFATVARWADGRLVVHDATQWPMLARTVFATMFSVPEEHVRVLVPYLGGGFGAGLRTSPHSVLTVLAARELGRPVKLVLTRPQMFTSIGHRPPTVQRIALGATRDGRLLALHHEGTATTGAEEFNAEPITSGTAAAYACPNVVTRDRLVALNLPNPAAMRAPGHTEGSFALESAMDELSSVLGVDPLELRLRNLAEVHPPSGLPWSSNGLRACYEAGAERFGWRDRDPMPRATRDGEWLVGQGMAGSTYAWWSAPCRAAVAVARDGTAVVRSAATDIGTGTYTIGAQVAAELLGLGVDRVRVEIGDTDLPPAPQSGGSGLAVAFTGAIEEAVHQVLARFMRMVRDDPHSPLRGRRYDEVVAADGCLRLAGDPSVGESYGEILGRHGLDDVTATGECDPRSPQEGADVVRAGAFAAQFAEVRVHERLGVVRVSRVVSAVDAGRVLNPTTARGQIAGAVVMALGMALFEETGFDPRLGRVTNATLADYLVPVHADVPDIDVLFVGRPDPLAPLGAKGLGELGLTATPAAVANAVFHATGVRPRALPIRL